MIPQECLEYYNNLIEILNTNDVSKFEGTLDKALKDGFAIDYNPRGHLTFLIEKEFLEREKLRQKYYKKLKLIALMSERTEDPCCMNKKERQQWEELKEYMYAYLQYRQGVEATQEADMDLWERGR